MVQKPTKMNENKRENPTNHLNTNTCIVEIEMEDDLQQDDDCVGEAKRRKV
jgi:hypothetical protein